MRATRYVYFSLIVLALIVAFGVWNPLLKADHRGHGGTPTFVVDASWPKPLPAPVDSNGVAHRWVAGEVAGSCIDAQDNVFTVNRAWERGVTLNGVLQGNQSGAIVGQDASASSIPAPPVIEYDSEGNTVAGWGNPALIQSGPSYGGAAYWPHGAHGCFVDYQGNIWTAGNGDGVVQKYPHDGGGGVWLLQIGEKGVCDGPSNNSAIGGAAVFPTCGDAHDLNSSHTLLNEPADVTVDPSRTPSLVNRATSTSPTATATTASSSSTPMATICASGERSARPSAQLALQGLLVPLAAATRTALCLEMTASSMPATAPTAALKFSTNSETSSAKFPSSRQPPLLRVPKRPSSSPERAPAISTSGPIWTSSPARAPRARSSSSMWTSATIIPGSWTTPAGPCLALSAAAVSLLVLATTPESFPSATPLPSILMATFTLQKPLPVVASRSLCEPISRETTNTKTNAGCGAREVAALAAASGGWRRSQCSVEV